MAARGASGAPPHGRVGSDIWACPSPSEQAHSRSGDSGGVMVRSGLLVAGLCVVLAGCDDSPSSSSTVPVVVSAQLSPANEVPPIGNAESVARGAAQVSFNVARDSAGAVTGGTATMYFQLTGLPSGTVIRGAHIHSSPAGVNGPIVVDTGITPVNTQTLADGRQEF